MTDENRDAAISHELRHGEQALQAARLLRDAALYLADYERTWIADAEVADQAFAEIEPLLERVRQLVVIER